MHSFLKTMNKSRSAFTILELSLVLVIMGFILFITFNLASNYYKVNQHKVTGERLDEIQDKLLLYLKNNGVFPCPDDPTLAKTDSGYANGEVCSTTCSVTAINADSEVFYAGDVPAILLGLSTRYAEDGFGYKFRYVIPKNLACNTKEDSDYYEKTLLYMQFNDGSNTTEIADDLAYILVSHGENAAGSYTVAGSQISTSANANEAENSDSDNIFRYQLILNSDFDDILRFKTKTQLLLDLDSIYEYTKTYRYFREECNAGAIPSELLPFCFNE